MPTYIKGKSDQAERLRKARILKKYKNRLRRSQIVKAPNGGPKVVINTSKSIGTGTRKKKGGCPFCG